VALSLVLLFWTSDGTIAAGQCEQTCKFKITTKTTLNDKSNAT
jgi:hypothetical protein